MAVYAAHLSRTPSGLPSVFVVAAQEALGAAVKPALRKIVEYLADVYPSQATWSLRWYDELYLLLDLALQHHYLKNYAASFSESFYGLMRVSEHVEETQLSDGVRLSARGELRALAALVLLPYLADICTKVIQRWEEQIEEGTDQKEWVSVRRAGVSARRWWCLAWYLARALQLAQYARAAHRSATLALRLTGQALTSAPDHLQHHTVGSAVLRLAQQLAFVVQFLRWWGERAGAHSTLPPPPPPPTATRASANVCPLCRGGWRTPAVLPVSGLVFCYSCISRCLRETGACPLTRLPADPSRLVRLYR